MSHYPPLYNLFTCAQCTVAAGPFSMRWAPTWALVNQALPNPANVMLPATQVPLTAWRFTYVYFEATGGAFAPNFTANVNIGATTVLTIPNTASSGEIALANVAIPVGLQDCKLVVSAVPSVSAFLVAQLWCRSA